MTALLYISYRSGQIENEKLIIDRQVSRTRNREKVCIVVKTLALNKKNKTKKVIVGIILLRTLFSNVEPSEAIGLSAPVVTVQSNYKERFEMKVAPTISLKLDKITFTKSRELPLCIYMMDENFLKTSGTIKIINKIRSGGLIEATTALIVIVIMWQILGLGIGIGIEGFVLNNPNREWGVDRPNPFQPPGGGHGYLRYPPVYDLFSPRPGSTLKITPPSSMPHQEFVELTKQEKRALPHINDMKIIHQGHPELEVGFWQTEFKVGDHGAVHNLPYIVKSNGGTKTEKSDTNTLKMMVSIVDMPNRNNVKWVENGTYQGRTKREFDAIHIYDLDKKIIAVFKKSTRKFVTTCELNFAEHTELLETGNFGGGKRWVSGQVRNLPPQQTNLNTFENDVTEITPISPMNENSSPGFTPTTSFENDVMTPIDKSQFDNP